MNTNQILDLLNQVSNNPSRSAKIGLLKFAACPTLSKVLYYALHPLTTYGIADTTAWQAGGSGIIEFTEEHWALLDKLANRSLTGNAAQAAVYVAQQELHPKSFDLLLRIITKDLRAGIAASTVNAAFPKLIPTFSPMLAAKFDATKVEFPAAVETKLDGLRALAFVRGKEVTFYTRTGHVIPTVDHIRKALSAYNTGAGTIVLDGELTAGTFLESVSALRKGEGVADAAVFNVFDVISESEFYGQTTSLPYDVRRTQLELLLPPIGEGRCVGYVPSTVVTSVDEIHSAYEGRRSEGLEGIIVKALTAPYQTKRHPAWMKLKAEESADLLVIGAVEGTGKYEGQLGCLVVEFGGQEVEVGSGLTDEDRRQLWEVWTTQPNLLMGRIAEVAYHEVTEHGSLRHPRFKGFRDIFTKGEKV